MTKVLEKTMEGYASHLQNSVYGNPQEVTPHDLDTVLARLPRLTQLDQAPAASLSQDTNAVALRPTPASSRA